MYSTIPPTGSMDPSSSCSCESSSSSTTACSLDVSLSLLKDRISAMKKQEASSSYQRCGRNVVATLFARSEHWRQTIVSWMFHVVDIFQLNHHIVAVAAYYLDVGVEQGLVVHGPLEYQLVALTSLQLAIKLYEFKIFPLSELVKLGHGDFVQQDVKQMERRLLAALKWKLHPPTPNCFLGAFMSVWPKEHVEATQQEGNDQQQRQHQQLQQNLDGSEQQTPEPAIKASAFVQAAIHPSTTTNTNSTPRTMKQLVEQTAQKLIQVAVCRDEFLGYPPSVLACAAILLVIDRFPLSPVTSTLSLTQMQQFILNIQKVSKLSSSSPGLKQAFHQLEPYLQDYLATTATTTSTCAQDESSTNGTSKSSSQEQANLCTPPSSGNSAKTVSPTTSESPRHVVIQQQ